MACRGGLSLELELGRGLTRNGLGKATRGYDPSQDIVWLRSEIVRWIEGNLMEKWYVLILLQLLRILILWKGLHKAPPCCHQYVKGNATID